MAEDVQKALASDRVIDITTTGRRTGEPRRIEIWFHRVGDAYYITGTPGKPRDWYANLVAHPAFTFHLKESATADLPATARPITSREERERVLTPLLAGLGDLTRRSGQDFGAWLDDSPLVEVSFEAA
jgi:deazaflavin-dependent oxidoreductase (nitroreductase family)